MSGGGSTPNAYRFAGEQLDVETGDYYLRARYYGAGVGRFRRMDEFNGFLNLPLSNNKYLYANSNPIYYIDPSGRFGMTQVMQVVVGVAAVVTTGYLAVEYVVPAVQFQIQDYMALSALRIANPLSIQNNIEYGGYIYKLGTFSYGFTDPRHNPDGGNAVGYDLNNSDPLLPGGAQVVGDYHTHGAYSIKDKNGKIIRTDDPNNDSFKSDSFKVTDIIGYVLNFKEEPRYRGYLGTPSGRLLGYDPDKLEIFHLN